MNSRKMWDIVMFLMVICFIGFVIYAKIDAFHGNKQAKEIYSKLVTKQNTEALDNVNMLKDGLISMYISEPFFSEDELNKEADMIVIGYIRAIKKENISEAKDPSGSVTRLNIPYVTYDVTVIESIKNPEKENNIKVKCMYVTTFGYNPSDIKQDDIYKFYLASGKEESYYLVSYRQGIQEIIQD